VFGTPRVDADPRRVGVEMRADARWRWKRWVQYPELIAALRADGCDVAVFEQRDDLRDFIADVNSCSVVVTGDTLTMHIALALGKRTVAVFGPTSAPEIHGYGRLTSIVSPIECISCYLRDCDVTPNCMQRIPLQRMHDAVRAALHSAP
jgi:heptosyltransferase-2